MATRTRKSPDDILGLQTIAEQFGWKPRTIHQWRYRESTGFPPPDGYVDDHPWWYRRTIAEWAKKDRPSGRRPRSA